ncbi:MAG: polysaccharide deacetylase family protein [Candidatus Limnocylindrales bacterium]
MRRSQVHRRPGHRYGAAAALVGGVVVLAVAGWAGVHWGGQRPTAAPSAPSASPVANVEVRPSGSRFPSPTPTATPQTPAPSYPLVNSCVPSSVPGSVAVTAPKARDNSFTLHVPILMYHRIVPLADSGNSSPGLVVPPEVFAAQLDAIAAAGWHTITMAALAADLEAHTQPPARSFVITIDDGWEDGYTHALPILRSHGYVATYFVIAGRIDKPDEVTSGELQALVAAGDEIGDHTVDHVDLEKLPLATQRYEIDAAAARIAQVTGRWPESFAYPSGGATNSDAAVVAACGVLHSGVVEEPVPAAKPGASKPVVGVPVALETWSTRFAIPRVRITPNTNPVYLAEDLRILSAG